MSEQPCFVCNIQVELHPDPKFPECWIESDENNHTFCDRDRALMWSIEDTVCTWSSSEDHEEYGLAGISLRHWCRRSSEMLSRMVMGWSASSVSSI
jgi:hypothetical protein